jgi:uncharacterized membrane protein YjdF
MNYPMTGRTISSRELPVLLALVGLVLIVSGIRPFDRATWWLEVAPVLVGAPILVATFSRFRLSPLCRGRRNDSSPGEHVAIR